jgi:1-deoxy-D-xylulose-5-phosphate synthase
MMGTILDRIRSPGDLVALEPEERTRLAEEIRRRIIDVVCCTGGHLASSLGVVELTVALLSVYDPSVDKVVWDVGHQTYPWKLLTGRRSRFHTMRQSGGISGFPRRDESPCDCFGTGHSSTSISAALGFALARDLRHEAHRVLAVIGDGSMTAGLAFEGLNNLGHLHTDMTVILNDNRMSISPNVGALSRHFTKLITDPRYNWLKDEVWNTLGKLPTVGDTVRRAAGYAGAAVKKTIINPVNVFDEFGVRYIGPVDGHDIPLLIAVLSRVKELKGPVLVHVVTKKGKGYHPAECEPVGFHGISGASAATPGESFTSVFGRVLVDMAESDDSIAAITAAMPDGTGLTPFAKAYPTRFFDVGIAEQHAVTFACGLAFGGLKPVVAIYSSFFQRSFDQLVHDAALQKAPVLFALDRAGIVGADGPTHHGVHDIAMFRQVPGTALAAPRDCPMLEALLRLCLARLDRPTAIRYPRGLEPERVAPPPACPEMGSGQIIRKGTDALIVAVGTLVPVALEAADLLEEMGISAGVYDPIWLKPMPGDELAELARGMSAVVTVEEGCLAGGFGEGVTALLEGVPVKCLGIPDAFQPHGHHQSIMAGLGLDARGICRAVCDLRDGGSR